MPVVQPKSAQGLPGFCATHGKDCSWYLETWLNQYQLAEPKFQMGTPPGRQFSKKYMRKNYRACVSGAMAIIQGMKHA